MIGLQAQKYSQWIKCRPSVYAGVLLLVCSLTAHGHLVELGTAYILISIVAVMFWFALYPRYRSLAIALLIALFAYGYTVWHLQTQRRAWLPIEQEGGVTEVHGVVTELPIRKDGNIKFFLRVVALESNADAGLKVGSLLLLSCYRCEHQFVAGETWRMQVKLKRPHGYASWGAFDYEKYLFRHAVVATGYLKFSDRAVKLKPADWRYGIQALRAHILESLQGGPSKQRVQRESYDVQSTTSRQAADQDDTIGLNIMLALTLGYKAGFSAHNREVFQNVGIAHLMVISGLHIGLIFALTCGLLSKLINCFPQLMNRYVRQHLVILPAMFVAVFYAAMAGFSIPTQRALLMLALYSALRFGGREANILQVLMLTAAVVVLFDVFAVLDSGFWMSFSAVFIIGVWQLAAKQKQQERRLESHTEQGLQALVLAEENSLGQDSFGQQSAVWIRQLLSLQVCLVVALMPLASHLFGQVSLVALVLNLVAIPLFSLAVIPLSLLLALLVSIFPEAASIDAASQLLQSSLTYLYGGVERTAELPFSSLRLAKPAIGITLLVTALACGLLLKQRIGAMVLLVGGSIMCQLLWSTQALQQPVITLLDVGQGLTMVVRHQRKTLVYDVGPRYRTGFNTAQAVLLPYLAERGVTKVDALIISHADNDHIGGYDMFTQNMPVDLTLTSRVDKIPIALDCRAGMQWAWGDLKFFILSPDDDTPQGSNNRSCVLLLEYFQTRILLTGDIEKPVEEYLLNQALDLRADILLVPHQGSKTSSTPAFIDAVHPKLALVAAGYRNQYGHPHAMVVERYLDRGIQLIQTPIHGSVEITVLPQSWTLNSFRKTHPRAWHAVH